MLIRHTWVALIWELGAVLEIYEAVTVATSKPDDKFKASTAGHR